MKTYAPEIVKLITKELDPKEVCTLLGLCTSAPKKVIAAPKVCFYCLLKLSMFNYLLQVHVKDDLHTLSEILELIFDP